MGPKKRKAKKISEGEQEKVVSEMNDEEGRVIDAAAAAAGDDINTLTPMRPSLVNDKKLNSAILVLENCLTPTSQSTQNSPTKTMTQPLIRDEGESEISACTQATSIEEENIVRITKLTKKGRKKRKMEEKEFVIPSLSSFGIESLTEREPFPASSSASAAADDAAAATSSSASVVSGELLEQEMCASVETANNPEVINSEQVLEKDKTRRLPKGSRVSLRGKKTKTVSNAEVWMVSASSGDELERIVIKRQRKVSVDEKSSSAEVEDAPQTQCLFTSTEEAALTSDDVMITNEDLITDANVGIREDDLHINFPTDQVPFAGKTYQKRRNRKMVNLKASVPTSSMVIICPGKPKAIGGRTKVRSKQKNTDGEMMKSVVTLSTERILTRSRKNRSVAIKSDEKNTEGIKEIESSDAIDTLVNRSFEKEIRVVVTCEHAVAVDAGDQPILETVDKRVISNCELPADDKDKVADDEKVVLIIDEQLAIDEQTIKVFNEIQSDEIMSESVETNKETLMSDTEELISMAAAAAVVKTSSVETGDVLIQEENNKFTDDSRVKMDDIISSCVTVDVESSEDLVKMKRNTIDDDENEVTSSDKAVDIYESKVLLTNVTEETLRSDDEPCLINEASKDGDDYSCQPDQGVGECGGGGDSEKEQNSLIPEIQLKDVTKCEEMFIVNNLPSVTSVSNDFILSPKGHYDLDAPQVFQDDIPKTISNASSSSSSLDSERDVNPLDLQLLSASHQTSLTSDHSQNHLLASNTLSFKTMHYSEENIEFDVIVKETDIEEMEVEKRLDEMKTSNDEFVRNEENEKENSTSSQNHHESNALDLELFVCSDSDVVLFKDDDEKATIVNKKETVVNDVGFVPLKKRRLRMADVKTQVSQNRGNTASLKATSHLNPINETVKKRIGNVLQSVEEKFPNVNCNVEANLSTSKTMEMPKGNKFVGMHIPTAGGLVGAVSRASQMGARALALFIKPQASWLPEAIDPLEAEMFKEILLEKGYSPHMVVPHGSYLLNCGASDAVELKKTRDSLADDLRRCQTLGLPIFNFHPGSFSEPDTIDNCICRIADSINYVHSIVSGVVTVIENTSGQKNSVGGTFSQLKQIVDKVIDKSRIGVCLDTCHAFAAGYDLRSETGYKNMIKELDETIGLQYLKAVHVNDSKDDLGSHLDHHAAIGKGKIGLTCFKQIMSDKSLEHIPLILETPLPGHKEEIQLLYSFIK